MNDIPEEIKEALNLRSLFLDRNKFKEIPWWIRELYSLQELGFSRNEITSLPEGIGSLYNLKYLSLRETEITDLPHEFYMLCNLNELDLNGTPIKNFSEEISGLEKLLKLDLNGTHISGLPESFSNLTNLKHLNLSSLKMPEIPAVIFDLNNLETLNLSATRARSISYKISNLIKLTEIDLSAMGLVSIPAEIFDLPKLIYLNLQGNKLREIPAEILNSNLNLFYSNKRQQEGVYVKGNPLESPPIEIIHAGGKAVASYFHSLKEKHKPLDEIKLLLVGEGGSGKTSLTKRLIGLPFDNNETQTHGINIHNYNVTAGGKNIKVNIWDFGGQEIMHATHQFFLSKRSAYVLVLDGRKDEKTEYWLKHIQSFGGDSPVIVVLNKEDENPAHDVNRRFLYDKYPMIYGFFKISCKTNNGLEKFKKALERTLSRVKLAKNYVARILVHSKTIS